MISKHAIRWTVALGAAALLWLALPSTGPLSKVASSKTWATGHGNALALTHAYQRWERRYQTSGQARHLRIPLRYAKGLSSAYSNAQGVMDLDLKDGTVKAQVTGLPPGMDYDLWLIGTAQTPRATASHLRLGRLFKEGTEARLSAPININKNKYLQLNLVAVVPAGQGPEQGILLSGGASLFQRLYYQRYGQTSPSAHEDWPFAALLPPVAVASAPDLADVLGEQVARGREIFIKETFAGNGRTCATCHRPENNHTIDPKFIASLPKRDPLFVAEFNPALKDLEKPTLLRQLGLIVEHVDGFDKPPILRGVPHTLGLNLSMISEAVDFPADSQFANALGWSGDGGVDDGSLRLFAKGAVIQHFPKTLNRAPGVDFRLPSDEELDALEAYMLSLGRQEELNLAVLKFSSPIVEQGKLLFDTKENRTDANGQLVFGSGNCKGCHENAGANSSTTRKNASRDTGVENARNDPARLIDPSIAFDGGFGHEHRANCGPTGDMECFGDGRFNVPSLIEAADTAPYFHNNSVNTLEEAIAFYNTEAFNKSPGSLTSSGKDRRVKIDSTEVVAISAFLRSVNALENIRSANQLAAQARALDRDEGAEILKLAVAETEDAVEVLEAGVLNLYPEALKRLKAALDNAQRALRARHEFQRNALIDKALVNTQAARALMVSDTPNT
jgi:hypothetical protein